MRIKYIINRIKNIDFKRMNEVLATEAKRNNTSTFKIKKDYFKCVLKYKMGYVDYMKCNAYNLSDESKKKLLTGENYKNLLKYLNPAKYRIVCEDKILTNKVFHKYIKRQYVDLRVTSLNEFSDFLKDKKHVYAKLIDGFGGAGIEKINVKEIKNLKPIYDKLIKNRQYLVEEEIIQHDYLNKINDSAVNNIRVVSILKDNKVYFIERILRINDGFTSTISSHDIQGRLDEKGNLISDMVDDNLNIFHSHPKTKKSFKNIKIPYMKETYELINSAAREIPNVRFVGWDIAITESGPEIIEANAYPCYTNYQYSLMHEKGKELNYVGIIKDILAGESKNVKW